jgi:hypothetical protein
VQRTLRKPQRDCIRFLLGIPFLPKVSFKPALPTVIYRVFAGFSAKIYPPRPTGTPPRRGFFLAASISAIWVAGVGIVATIASVVT